MLKPSLPIDENNRLGRLHGLRILDTAAENRFDRITRMAQRLFGSDICLVSLIDKDRQWCKSRQGFGFPEVKRDISFCAHAILDDEIFVIPDTADDIRFHDNPLVTDEPRIRFYAGCPLHEPGGHRVGTLCILDTRPRDLSADAAETLRDLASMVENEIQVSAQITIDELTSLPNRRGFHMMANHLLSLCRRTGADAELALFDIDQLKTINESYGDATGDSMLVEFADMLASCFRTADAIGRVGGDEFAVLLSASSNSASSALTRLRGLASNSSSEMLRKLRWSVGTIQYDAERHDTLEILMADADACMYNDKIRRRIAGGL
ncbi:MAG: sensor domain-containing diguanylate cyclase [Gammaproteobacteria bacterium]|nr:sensor domain-containing diguanylate cyclase [Gammaproteobacteria bacterium]